MWRRTIGNIMNSPKGMEPINDLAPVQSSALSALTQEYEPPSVVKKSSNNNDWAELNRRASLDTETFWEQYAQGFLWTRRWDRVLRWDGSHHGWFVGGRTNITINALDRHAESERCNQAAYIWLGEDGTERIITYRQLHRSVCRFANGLKSLNVKKGDRVVIYMPLTIEGIVAMLACARVGAIHSVVYAGLGHTALRDRIIDAKARIIITSDAAYRRGKTVSLKVISDEAIRELDCPPKVVVFSRQGYKPVGEYEYDFDELLKGSPHCVPEEMDSEDPLFILYTSGSTGKPKGVVHVHGGYMVGVTWHMENFYDVGREELFWCTSDIGWIVGHSYIVYGPLCAGITTVVREGAIDFPKPDVAWEIVERYGINKLFTAPTALRMFMRYGEQLPQSHDLSSLRVIACAGEPLNAEAWRWAQRYLGGDDRWGYVVDNWWQTELGAPCIGTPSNMPMRPGKAGIALPGCQVEIVNENGEELPANTSGFLVIKKPFPHMMRTVWGDDARYEWHWKQIAGYYVSGDMGAKDEDGYISILGRIDDVLNVAGHRIGTAEVESAIVSHQGVAECAVVGVPDPIKGERIKAFVQTRLSHVPSEELAKDISAHVRDQLGPIATPGSVEFVASLPKTRSGKILRRYLKAKELGLDPGDLSTLEE
jgi:acetyl-CoA synthetase